MLAALFLTSALAADHTVAISANKLRYPGLDVEYERKIHEKMSLGGFVGFGRYTPLLLELAQKEAKGTLKKSVPKALLGPLGSGGSPTSAVQIPPLSYKTLGMRYHWMPFGSFEQGIFVGASMRWLHLTTSSKKKSQVNDKESGASAEVQQAGSFRMHSIMLGPHAGYKITLGRGFTASFLVGPGYTYAKGRAVARVTSEGVTGTQPVKIQSTGPFPYGTILAGWTF